MLEGEGGLPPPTAKALAADKGITPGRWIKLAVQTVLNGGSLPG